VIATAIVVGLAAAIAAIPALRRPPAPETDAAIVRRRSMR